MELSLVTGSNGCLDHSGRARFVSKIHSSAVKTLISVCSLRRPLTVVSVSNILSRCMYSEQEIPKTPSPCRAFVRQAIVPFVAELLDDFSHYTAPIHWVFFSFLSGCTAECCHEATGVNDECITNCLASENLWTQILSPATMRLAARFSISFLIWGAYILKVCNTTALIIKLVTTFLAIEARVASI